MLFWLYCLQLLLKLKSSNAGSNKCQCRSIEWRYCMICTGLKKNNVSCQILVSHTPWTENLARNKRKTALITQPYRKWAILSKVETNRWLPQWCCYSVWLVPRNWRDLNKSMRPKMYITAELKWEWSSSSVLFECNFDRMESEGQSANHIKFVMDSFYPSAGSCKTLDNQTYSWWSIC